MIPHSQKLLLMTKPGLDLTMIGLWVLKDMRKVQMRFKRRIPIQIELQNERMQPQHCSQLLFLISPSFHSKSRATNLSAAGCQILTHHEFPRKTLAFNRLPKSQSRLYILPVAFRDLERHLRPCVSHSDHCRFDVSAAGAVFVARA